MACDLLGIAALGSQACGAGFEHEARPPGLLHVAEVAPRDRRTPIRREVDQPLADESGERFAERSPRDAELLGERLLPQPGAGRELSATMRWRSSS